MDLATAPSPGPVRALRLLVSRHRRLLATLAVFCSVWAGLTSLAPGTPPGVAVVVAAATVPGGTPLTDAQVAVRTLPPDAVPVAALTDPASAVGRTPAGPINEGSVLTEVMLVGGATAAGSAEAVVPARLDDAGIVGLLRVGDSIDLMATDPQTGEVTRVARGARVVSVPGGAEGPLGVGSGDEDLLLLAVSAEEATEITRAAATSRLSVVLA